MNIQLSRTEVLRRIGENPIGNSFTFRVAKDGWEWTYTGVSCVVDGEVVTFRLDDAATISMRPPGPSR